MPFFSRHEEPVPVQPQPVQQKHGLFSRHEEPAPVQPVQQETGKRHGLFGSKRESVPPPAAQPVYEERGKKHGLFGSRRSPSPSPSSSTRRTTSTSRTSPDRSSGSGILHRSFGNGSGRGVDPSITQARERVMGAEVAEREADRALIAARESVRAAREHVRRLELEAEEEARRAKIKQHQARDISKRGQQLGRTSSLLTTAVWPILTYPRPWRLNSAHRSFSISYPEAIPFGDECYDINDIQGAWNWCLGVFPLSVLYNNIQEFHHTHPKRHARV